MNRITAVRTGALTTTARALPLRLAFFGALIATWMGCGGDSPPKEAEDSARVAGSAPAGLTGGERPNALRVPEAVSVGTRAALAPASPTPAGGAEANPPQAPPPECITIRRGVLGAVFDAQLASDPSKINKNWGAVLAFNVGPVGSGTRESLVRFDLGVLPPNLGITSATMTLQAREANSGNVEVFVNGAGSTWTEGTVTYALFYGNPAPQYGPLVATAPSGVGPMTWDLTATVAAWASGTPNNGVRMAKTGLYHTNFFSSEDPVASLRPRLDVCYTPDLCAGVVCAPLDQCHDAGTCDTGTGVCSNPEKANGAACTDGNACTQTDTCQAGTCVASNPVTCTASDQCHDAGTCDTATGACSNPNKANGTSCSDGNACTQSDTCQAGTCVGSNPVTCTASDQCHVAGTCDTGTGVCSNPNKANGAACADGNACTQSDTCQAGTCVGANPVTCTASDQCHNAGVCDTGTGACSNPNKANGAACADGNACTQSDTCQAGICVGANPVTCTASDQCHNAGVCDTGTGACSNPNKANGAACTDGNACTQSDTCQAGTCVGANPVTCTASDQCHNAGTCDTGTGVCSNPNKANGSACADGNACTQTDTCQAGTCVGSNPVTCTASDQCHNAGMCDTGTGVCSNPNKANGSACADGNACTQTDTCQAGTCVGSNPVTCTASDQCHDAGTCNTGTGVCSNPNKANGSACNDGNACTQTDTCQAGTCVGSNPVTCTASDQCHDAGTCNTGTGVCSNPNKANGSACADGNACTQTDTCQAGTCVGANPVTCTASDQCHNAGTCDTGTGTCSNPNKANGSACADGNACTQTDTCLAGTCVGSNPVTCTASDQCHDAGTCNTGTGVCSNPNKANGSACADGNACTQTDTCQAGTCVGANPVTCTASDQCHNAGTCDTGTGVCSNPNKANGSACADGNACTQTDTCQAGTCVGSNPVTCTASDQCHDAGTCNTGTGVCSNPNKANGAACADGNACTQSDTCQGGACTGSNPVTCTASDQCHLAGTCNTGTGVCSNPNKANGTACNDADACTQTDTCQTGSCVGSNPAVGCMYGDLQTTAGTSCFDILTNRSSPPDGLYWVDTNGGSKSDAFRVYCDMTRDGGGWTLVLVNNGGVTPGPDPSYAAATTAVNVTGSFGSNLAAFDLLLGVGHWNALGTKMRIEVGTSPTSRTKSATYNFSLNPAANYAITFGAGGIDLGPNEPGLKTYSAAGGFGLSTYDNDVDVYPGSCHDFYGYAWWYGACWNGNLWGSRLGGYADRAFWEGSGSDYHEYGAIWVRPECGAGGCPATMAASCFDIKVSNPASPSGVYQVDPNGGSNADSISVYCDMVRDGGGWTLVLVNNAGVAPGPDPSYAAVTSSVNVTGTFGANLAAFDLFLALDRWTGLGNKMRIEVGTSPVSLTKQAIYQYSINPNNSYSLGFGPGGVTIGSGEPGIKTFSGAGGYGITTYDHDVDTYPNNCQNLYGYAWWYGACWSGTFWGSRLGGYQDKAFWDGSGSDYHDYGAIWVRPDCDPAVGCKAGDTARLAGSSCLSIKTARPTAPDGVYWVDTSGGSTADAFRVYCDMTRNGGGWALVLANNGGVSPGPDPSYAAAVSGNNFTGALTSTLQGFDVLVGVQHWSPLGAKMRIEVGSSPASVSKQAIYDFAMNPANSYSLSYGAGGMTIGSGEPGIKTYSAAGGFGLSTYDHDADVYGGSCHDTYGYAWWYGACWSGTFWGSRLGGYQDRAYWEGSGSDYHEYGGLWVR